MQAYESFVEKTKKLLLKCQESETVSFGEVINSFGYSSHYILILFLTIPFLQPIPLPWASLVFGICIALSSIGIILSKRLFLPKILREHRLPSKKVVRTTSFLLKISAKVEKWLHPRGRFMSKHILLRKINGCILLGAGLLLALPLPIPLTNTLPAYSIAAICLGSLKEDGLFISIGWLLFGIAALYIFFLTDYFHHLLANTVIP